MNATAYEYEVQGYYGEWECLTTEATSREAYARVCEYRDAESGTSFRVKRVKVEATAQPCDGCNAEAGEACRWGCLSHTTTG